MMYGLDVIIGQISLKTNGILITNSLQIFWNEDELDMIRQSSLYHETVDKKIQIEKEFFALKPVRTFLLFAVYILIEAQFI